MSLIVCMRRAKLASIIEQAEHVGAEAVAEAGFGLVVLPVGAGFFGHGTAQVARSEGEKGVRVKTASSRMAAGRATGMVAGVGGAGRGRRPAPG